MIVKQLSRFNVDDSGLVRVVTTTPSGTAPRIVMSEGWVSDRVRRQLQYRDARPRSPVVSMTAGTGANELERTFSTMKRFASTSGWR